MGIDIKKIILSDEYSFLKANEHLGDNIILLTLGGSHAYGTQRDDGKSDIDLRGIALERSSDLIGFTKFEQVIDTETDTTIYAFNKIISLLMECNPNVCEILGNKPEQYIILTDIGQQLLDNKKMFLSQRCIDSFGGYAQQQLQRLTNSLARDRVSQTEKEDHIRKSIERAMISFETRYTNFDNSSIKLEVKESNKTDLESELFINIHLDDYPLRDLYGALSEMQSILKTYGKINHRNKKKDDNHLDKHAQHLIRLYLMAIDILEKEEIITHRENDLELLRRIRTGGFRRPDGTYDESFFEMQQEYEKRLEYAAKNTSLPLEPKIKEIEEIVMEVNKKIIVGRG